MKSLKFALIALFWSLVACEKARYDNYRVYEILIENDDQLELMKHIENYPDGVSLKTKSEKFKTSTNEYFSTNFWSIPVKPERWLTL
jgi:hypothetical protein